MPAQANAALGFLENHVLKAARPAGQGLGRDITLRQAVDAAEPKIADVVVISPREVMVNAKEPGKTTVIVWEDGNPIRYNVDVIAEWNNDPAVTREDVNELLSEVIG